MSDKLAVDGVGQRMFQAWKSFEGERGSRVTQGELADLVGESQPTLSDWFAGKREPSLRQVLTFCRVVRASPGWISYNEGVMKSGHHPPAKPMPPGERIEAKGSRRGIR